MELLTQIGGFAGLASLVGVLLAFLIKYRRGSTDAFAAASKAFNDHLESSRKDFHAQIAGFQTQITGLHEHLESSRKDFHAQIAGFQAQITGLHEQMESSRKDFQTQIAGFQSQLSGFQSQVSNLQIQTETWQGLYKVQTEENQKLVAEVAVLKAKIEQLTGEIDKLRTENHELKGLLKASGVIK